MTDDALQRRLRPFLHRWLRLPPKPEPPWGDPASVRTFRAAPGYLRLKIYGWIVSQVGALAVIVLALFGIDIVGTSMIGEFFPRAGTLIEFGALGLFFLEAAFAWVMLHLDYQNRWYLLTDRSLRIRDGLWRVREMTLSLANIQNVNLKQGPLQRLVGIGDIEVRTAGGGARPTDGDKSASMHLGILRGIDDADAVRDHIVERWRAVRKDGTASPPAERPPEDPLAALLAAGRALETEARALASR